jgi:hypothetical protein
VTNLLSPTATGAFHGLVLKANPEDDALYKRERCPAWAKQIANKTSAMEGMREGSNNGRRALCVLADARRVRLKTYRLLNGTGCLRENTVRVGTDHPDCAHDEHQNHGQHDSIFGDVLTLVFRPKSGKEGED